MALLVRKERILYNVAKGFWQADIIEEDG